MTTSLAGQPSTADAPDESVLDNPAYFALTGPQAHLAQRIGNAVRFPVDVSPFFAVPDPATAQDLADLRELLHGQAGASAGVPLDVPEQWRVDAPYVGVQLTGADVRGEPDVEAVPLGAADVPEILALIARTQPGPFLPRTIEFGGYMGIRHDGELVAMAGERLHPPGWTEVSAVCTDERFRGQGLAGRLVRAVAANIQARGDQVFLHTGAKNVGAIRLYESLGFRIRRTASFETISPPA